MSGAWDLAPFQQITLVGIGLINGSLARDLRRLGLARRLVGTARRAETLQQALDLGLVDIATTDAAAAAENADIVVLGTPVGAFATAARAVAPGLTSQTIVTDVGSVKAQVSALVRPHIDLARFVPAHPIAGGEASGPAAAVAGLFHGRWCILTPGSETDPWAVQRVAALWRAVGARVEFMDAGHHDTVLAAISHLPHLLAFNAVNTARDVEDALGTKVLKYAGGGYRDFTRIAGADPAMWRDVFLHNRTAVLDVLGRYIKNLTILQQAIHLKDAEALHRRFSEARDTRTEAVQWPAGLSRSDGAQSLDPFQELRSVTAEPRR